MSSFFRGGQTVDVQGTAGGVLYGKGTGTAAAFNAAGTTGQMLESGVAGAPTWIDKSAILKSQNGLTTVTTGGSATATSPYVELGGSLYKATTVTQAANTLAFTSTATNGFSVDGTTFSVDAANDRVGIGTVAPANTLSVNGTIEAIDFGAAGSRNIIVGDDVFLTDIDQAHTLGVYSTSDASLGIIRLGNGNNQIRTTGTTQTGNFGSANGFDFDAVDNSTKGILLEAGDAESGGFFANGNTAAIWSPGDGTSGILSIYDEDNMNINVPQIRVEGDGDLRMYDDNTIHMKNNIATLVSRGQVTHDNANSGYRSVGGTTNGLLVDAGDIVIINVTLKCAFTGGSGNDDIRFALGISGCASTTDYESFYIENFDNDRNEYQPVAMQFVYSVGCTGTLNFQLFADNNSNADDSTKYGDLVIVATKY